MSQFKEPWFIVFGVVLLVAACGSSGGSKDAGAGSGGAMAGAGGNGMTAGTGWFS